MEKERRKSFWASLPGIITAIATLIGSIAGLIAILNSSNSSVTGDANQTSKNPEIELSIDSTIQPEQKNESAPIQQDSSSGLEIFGRKLNIYILRMVICNAVRLKRAGTVLIGVLS